MSVLTRKLASLNPSRLGISAISSNAALVDNCTQVSNRNPRNLELLRIARKPDGYHLERVSRKFWHELIITRGVKHVEVHIEHIENGPVITASTKEWSLKKRLYSYQDSSAYMNIGRVLAERCIESGIFAIHVNPHMPKGGKIDLLLSKLEEGGVALVEPPVYKNPHPWDLERPEKPWDVIEP
ncbi:39S ribosomal protein L18, mitochondrial [Diachasma alloeum]|uniref:39S ribosomal protein L18, mitochondrial n=1 Tax=Diachasma alloeum TaxID=454923 RepID=UPI00073835EB|nr:39S ribosomal protein L18, mitochondrial [Diachasma alloeum]